MDHLQPQNYNQQVEADCKAKEWILAAQYLIVHYGKLWLSKETQGQIKLVGSVIIDGKELKDKINELIKLGRKERWS